MELVVALLPGGLTGLFGFGTLVILAGRFFRRRFQHGWKLVASYALVVGLLWIACFFGGAALFWPVIKQHGHAAIVMFLIPYVIITFSVAGVALMKYGSEMLSNTSLKVTPFGRGTAQKRAAP